MYRPAHRARRPRRKHISLLVLGVSALLIPAAVLISSPDQQSGLRSTAASRDLFGQPGLAGVGDDLELVPSHEPPVIWRGLVIHPVGQHRQRDVRGGDSECGCGLFAGGTAGTEGDVTGTFRAWLAASTNDERRGVLQGKRAARPADAARPSRVGRPRRAGLAAQRAAPARQGALNPRGDQRRPSDFIQKKTKAN